MSTGAKVTAGFGGVGAAGLIGFLVYKKTRPAPAEGGKKESKKALKKLMASKKASAKANLINQEDEV